MKVSAAILERRATCFLCRMIAERWDPATGKLAPAGVDAAGQVDFPVAAQIRHIGLELGAEAERVMWELNPEARRT